jgi:hypothetical protein
LYCNEKKTKLFQLSIKFLGHKISAKGIEADDSKIERILNWPTPKSSTNVRAFLGVVRYISQFLPNLAAHTEILHHLTTKAADKCFPGWGPEHEAAFQGIKEIVVSHDCLTTINHQDMGDNKIFVTADASDRHSSAVLSYGPTWETARPVAFDSMTFKVQNLITLCMRRNSLQLFARSVAGARTLSVHLYMSTPTTGPLRTLTLKGIFLSTRHGGSTREPGMH